VGGTSEVDDLVVLDPGDEDAHGIEREEAAGVLGEDTVREAIRLLRRLLGSSRCSARGPARTIGFPSLARRLWSWAGPKDRGSGSRPGAEHQTGTNCGSWS